MTEPAGPPKHTDPDPAVEAAVLPEPSTSSRVTSSPEETPLIRNRDFQALWISRFLANIGKEAAEVAYPLLILAVTGRATYAGAVGATQMLVAGGVSVVGGTLTDRIDRRLLLIGCDAGRVVLLGLFSWLVFTGYTSVPVVFAVIVGSAVCLGLSEPPALAAIKQVVPPSQLTRATAQNQIRPLGATVAGAPIGSSLFGVARALPFIGTALTFVCATVALLFIRRPLQAPSPDKGKERRKASEGVRFVARQPVLFIWIVWIMGSNMAFNHTGAFLALIATAKARGVSESIVGATLAIAGSGALVGAFLATRILHRVRPATIFIGAAWVGPVAAVLLMVLPGVLPLGIVLACAFVRGPIINALFFAYVATLVPDRLQGRVLGAVTFLSYVAQPLGILLVGAIFDLGGSLWVFIFMAVVSSLAALPTLTRRIRTLRAPEEMAAENHR